MSEETPSRFLKTSGDADSLSDLWALTLQNHGSNSERYEPSTFAVGDPYHDRLVRDYDEQDRYYVEAAQGFYEETMDNYDLYLAQVPDQRSKDELWRANIFVPLPGTNVEARVTNEANIVTRADPIFQVEGVQGPNRDLAKQVELLLDGNHRTNRWRKFFLTSRRAVAIQGTDFIKPIWTRRSHRIRVWTSKKEKDQFVGMVQEAVANGAPFPPNMNEDPEGFEKWRTAVNLASKTSRPIPEFPADGPREIVRFEGPELIRLPLHAVHVDPMVDEIKHQTRVYYRTLAPLDWVLDRTGEDPEMPFRPEQVVQAMQGWDGEDLERYDREVSRKMGFNPQEKAYRDPFYKNAVELTEVYDQDAMSPVKFGIMMNRKAIINKDYEEYPTWAGGCVVTAIRNMQLPGHFFGISDYKWPKSLYEELRHLRNMRSDYVTQTVLPAWTKLKESGVPDLMRLISPGAIITVNRHDAVRPLDHPNMPNEAYREPQEIKSEIADAHGIWDATKGAPATVGRVTSVEFSGRAQQTQVRLLMGVAAFEEEYLDCIQQQVSMFAQNWRDEYKYNYGGELQAVGREDLIKAMNYHLRFRGVSMALDRNLQVQQLLQVASQFAPSLPPASNFKLMRLILEMLEIRGLEDILSVEEMAPAEQQGAAAGQAGQAESQAATDEAAAAGVDTSKAGSVQQPPPAAPPAQGQ